MTNRTTQQSQKGGRGSNLTHADRVRGGEHSHEKTAKTAKTSKTAQGQGRSGNLSQADRAKGGRESHKG